MRTLQRNKTTMFYSKWLGSQPIYERDSDGNIIYETYVDSDGTEYTYPKEIGIDDNAYSIPQKIEVNIVFSGGEAEAKEFGLDLSDYHAVIICEKDEYDIDETTLIWLENAIVYKDIDKTIIEPNSADFMVVKKSPSLNYSKYALRRKVTDGKEN